LQKKEKNSESFKKNKNMHHKHLPECGGYSVCRINMAAALYEGVNKEGEK